MLPFFGRKAFTVSATSHVSSLSEELLQAEIEAGNLIARVVGGEEIVLLADLEKYLRALPRVSRRQQTNLKRGSRHG
jgi:hypothetical protein